MTEPCCRLQQLPAQLALSELVLRLNPGSQRKQRLLAALDTRQAVVNRVSSVRNSPISGASARGFARFDVRNLPCQAAIARLARDLHFREKTDGGCLYREEAIASGKSLGRRQKVG